MCLVCHEVGIPVIGLMKIVCKIKLYNNSVMRQIQAL